MSNIRLTSNFSPTQISGCQLWLDAADSTSIVTSGTTVTAVIDKSGTNKAITVTNTVSYLTRQSLVFTNTTGLLTVSGMPSAPYDILTVASPNSSTSTYRTLLRTISNTGTHPFLLEINNNNLGMWDSTAFRQFGSLTLSPNEKALVYATMASGRTMQASKNGEESLTLSTPAGNESSIRFIGNNGGGSQSWGSLQELLIFNTTLSLASRQRLEGYLAWKWGLNKSLPLTHPYYNYPVYSVDMPNIVFPLYSYKSPLFQPTFFPNCTLWLDSADRSTLTMNNNLVVTQWRDKSGLANHASNVGTIRLTSQIGGLPTMTYPGTVSTYFIGPLVNSGPTFTAFSVFLMNTSSYVVARILSLARIGSVDYSNTLYTAAIQRNSGNFGAFRNLTSLGSITGTFGTAVQVSSRYSGSNHTIFMNGVAGTSVNTSGNFGYSNYEVGSSFGEENLVPLNGTIGEVIHFNRALSTDERQQMEGYLATKWGLQADLPANHPYKSVAFGAQPPFPLVPLMPKSVRNEIFSPVSVGNLQAWFDAADSSTVTVSGSSVSQWRDKSSNAYSVGQVTASNQPSYSYAIQNKKNGIQFATSSFLFAAGSSMPNFTTGAATSVFIAAKNASTNTGWNIFNTIWFIGINGGTQRYHLSFNQNTTDGTTLYTNGSLVGQVTSNAVLPSSNAILGFTASSTSQTIHTNGSINTYSGTTLPAANNTTYFMFGDARNNTTASSDTVVYEMVGYNVQVNLAQRQQIEGYLAWKWGLVANLPSAHPFKLFPPSS